MSDKIWIDEAWRVPDDLAVRLQKSDYKDALNWEIERTAQVRVILTDLIAEMRDLVGVVGNEDDSTAALSRAEERLREIGE